MRMTEKKKKDAMKMRKSGLSYREMSKQLGISHTAIKRHLDKVKPWYKFW